MAVGRPRAFDTDEALDRALQVFWRKGYEGSSLSDLTEAMGINPPSLYAAFGNKEGLFRQVLERYMAGPASYARAALAAPTARAIVEQLMSGAADLLTDQRNPGGCLLVQGALSSADGADHVRQELNARRAAGEAALRQRLMRAKSAGDLPADADPSGLARFIAAVIYGMAVQAAGGASRKDLQPVIEMALRAWPDGVKAQRTRVTRPAGRRA
jgi:AcrR family transcriptional regulator